jgi:hypothetical protein
MKKIFTLAAAVLASFSLMAEDATFTLSEIFDGNNQSKEVTAPVKATVSTNASKSGAKDGKLGSDGNYFQVVLAEQFFSAASLNGYINTTSTDGKNWAFQFSTDGGETWSDEVLQAHDGNKTFHDIAVDATIPTDANGFRVVRRSGTSALVASITLTLAAAAPVENPVTSVELSGPAEGVVGKTLKLKATPDVKASEFYWTLDGDKIDGAAAASYDFVPAAAGEYKIKAWARNEKNAEGVFVASNELVIKVADKLNQVDVTETTVWDWTKAGSVSTIQWTDKTSPAKNEEVLLANVDGINNSKDFNSQALLFSGEYPVRDGKYAQGAYIIFNAAVDGSVQVVFSNTGGGDRPKRYIAVNGVVNTEVGSDTADKATSAKIDVKKGEVMIEGSFEEHEPQYIRIYSITFTAGGATAIDNTEVEAKAVKVIRDGQMFIMKNGVLYNAQGAVVR